MKQFDCGQHLHPTEEAAKHCQVREFDWNVMSGQISPIESEGVWHQPPRRVAVGVVEVAVYGEDQALPYGSGSLAAGNTSSQSASS